MVNSPRVVATAKTVRRRLLFVVTLLVALLLVAELAVSTYFCCAGKTLVSAFFESPGVPVLRFDPATGYRFCDRPFRMTALYDGNIEYLSQLRPNKLGFLDNDTPTPERRKPDAFRVVVFGDSFTDGWFLDMNWPNRLEQLARQQDLPVELLNMAQGGTGLGNWAALLDEVLLKDNYDIDAVIFAVFEDDLVRRRTFLDFARDDTLLVGRAATWRPDSFPRTREEALAQGRRSPVRMLSPAAFEHVLSAKRAPLMPILLTSARMFLPLLAAGEQDRQTDLKSADRHALMRDMASDLARQQWPALVVVLPRSTIVAPPRELVGIDHYYAPELVADIRDFAKLLNAPAVDGSGMLAGLTLAEADKLWHPNDTHWNQAGSDRFARFMLPVLAEWMGAVRAAKKG